jgi:TonB family protein
MNLFLDSTINVSLIVLVGLGVAALLRNRSAAVRHWVIATAVFSAMASPLVELVVPSWDLQLGTLRLISSQPAAPRDAVTVSSGAPTLALTENVTAARQGQPTSSLRRWIAPAWMAGAGASVLVLLVGFTRLGWLASRARPVSAGPWPRIAADVSREYALRQPVLLLQSSHPSLLVTWGLVQPKVILPNAAPGWSDDRIRIVLRHELAHIRRGDWLIQIAAELLRAAYWFNPLLWVACTRLRQESEQACDDEVLTGGVDGPDYATHLLDLARALKVDSAPRLPAPAIARSSSLERRFRAMLDARLTRNPTTRSFRLLTAGGLLAATVALAAAQTAPTTLSGSVVDSTGAPVPEATVALINTQSQARYEVKTNEGGQFSFVPLPPDNYVLVASLPGFKKLENPVALKGKNVRRDLTLSLGELQETITVGGNNMVTRRLPGARDSEGRSGYQRDLESCKPSQAGGRVRPPRKLKDVRPIYPEALREAKVGGKVGLQATIGTDGSVREVSVLESVNPELDNAAIEAVKQWQFDGTLLNCNPVDVVMKVTINFTAE